MRRHRRRPVVVVPAALCLLLTGPAVAGASVPEPADSTTAASSPAASNRPSHDSVLAGDDGPNPVYEHQHQDHGPELGHLPPTRKNVDLIGKTDIDRGGEGRGADVSAYGNYAYMSTRDPEGCSDAGMAVIDISDPARPHQVGLVPSTEGSFPGEGSQVIELRTKAFTGPVLVFNNERCAESGKGGVSLWDVRDPLQPRPLTRHAGDPDAGPDFGVFNEIHSMRAWQDGGRAFVVLVDNLETTDVDIMEITDPTAPKLLTELDLNTFPIRQPSVLGQTSFFHDVEVKKIDGTWTMLLSYWDGGWVLLDVDEPARPRFIRDSDFPATDPTTGKAPYEGNAHQAEFSPDNEFVIGTSEDFAPYRAELLNFEEGTNVEAAAGTESARIETDRPLVGRTVFVGRACVGDPAVPPAPANAKVAVVERGICLFDEKVAAIEAAGGYKAIVIMNRTAADACTSVLQPSLTSTLPTVLVGRQTGFALFDRRYDNAACLAGTGEELSGIPIGTVGDEIKVRSVFDGWGHVHLMRTDTMQQIDAYAIDEATDPRYADNFGALSVHEVAVDPDVNGLAYLSYYSGGLRVIEYDGDGIREVGRFIDESGNNFWGVEVHKLPGGRKLVLASDIDGGLSIFQYTGG